MIVVDLNERIKELLGRFKGRKLSPRGSRELITLLQEKQAARHKLPAYRDRYRWLTIYDEEIDFLLAVAKRAVYGRETRANTKGAKQGTKAPRL